MSFLSILLKKRLFGCMIATSSPTKKKNKDLYPAAHQRNVSTLIRDSGSHFLWDFPGFVHKKQDLRIVSLLPRPHPPIGDSCLLPFVIFLLNSGRWFGGVFLFFIFFLLGNSRKVLSLFLHIQWGILFLWFNDILANLQYLIIWVHSRAGDRKEHSWVLAFDFYLK